MKGHWFLLLFLFCFGSCKPKKDQQTTQETDIELMVLGAAQDGGYPQVGCTKACCKYQHEGKVPANPAVCLALHDKLNNKVYFFEATPHYALQWQNWKKSSGDSLKHHPDGFFITHAHVGHYTGLMQLGREVLGTTKVPVFVMPKMKAFLRENGPWSQLVALNNINLKDLVADSAISLSAQIKVTPFLVPHRDEYSETVGFKISIKGKNILFIPDIDKWQKWNRNIVDEIAQADMAFIDATFYKNGELNRDMSEIPHPFVEESMKLFANLDKADKNKVYFIHFNHTNPLIWDKNIREHVEKKDFHVAQTGQVFAF